MFDKIENIILNEMGDNTKKCYIILEHLRPIEIEMIGKCKIYYNEEELNEKVLEKVLKENKRFVIRDIFLEKILYDEKDNKKRCRIRFDGDQSLFYFEVECSTIDNVKISIIRKDLSWTL